MNLDELFGQAVVAELHLRRPHVVTAGTSVAETLAGMRSTRTAAALVVEDDRVVGLFTEVDYVRKVLGETLEGDTTIDTMMTKAPTTVRRDTSLAECMRLMSEGDFRHLPVVDGSSRPTHIVTVRQLSQYLAERYPSEVLAMAPNVHQITEEDGG